jgi:hypothetical protein
MTARRDIAVGLLVVGLATLGACSRSADTKGSDQPVASSGQPAPTNATATAVRALARQAKAACGQDLPGPNEIQQCNDKAIEGLGALLSPRSANAELMTFYQTLFEPLELSLTGGEDTLAARVTVSGAYVDFSKARAEILLSLPDAPFARAKPPSFEWVKDADEAEALRRQWAVIVAKDCRAYAVPDCAARLNAAVDKLIETTRH